MFLVPDFSGTRVQDIRAEFLAPESGTSLMVPELGSCHSCAIVSEWC